MDAASTPGSCSRRAIHSRRDRIPPERRKRVAIACNSCSLRRIKCSGDRPCRQCSRASHACEYPEATDKVSISRVQLEALQARCAHLERCVQSSAKAATPSSPTPGNQQAPEDMTLSEGRLLHDPDGTARYFGESSGANFLNHVKEFVATVLPLVNDRGLGQPGGTFLASVGHYQTFDSRPLSLPPVDPLRLPRRTEMTVMLAHFRYLLHDGNRDFPSGGIFYWGGLPSAPPDPQGAAYLRERGELALLHIVFAVAVQIGSPAHGEDKQRSEAYFSRARLILGNPLDITMYDVRNISALLVMALYLIEVNRRDAAYMMVTIALRLAVMYGAHNGCGGDEGNKRVFWTLYIVDGWLSAWLGRPPSIAEEAIRLSPPQEVDDLPPAAGLRAHVELTRISRYIVCNVYRISPWDKSSKTTLQHVKHALKLLREWLDSLPQVLQIDHEALGEDRACCSLYLEYNQLVILTTRPIFFVAAKKTIADRYLSGPSQLADHQTDSQSPLIQQCSSTARQSLRLGRWVRHLSPTRKLLHHEAHAVFNAAIILLIHQLASADVAAEDASHIRFAIEVFEYEASLGNNFGVDCAKVLQDLSHLAQGLPEQTVRRGEQASNPSRTTTLAGDFVGALDDPDSVPGEGAMLGLSLPLTEQGLVFQELQSWLDNDYYQLYNDYLA